MLIIVVGGWVLTTIAPGIIMQPGRERMAIGLGGVLSLGWYALIILEARRWWLAARGKRSDAPRPAGAIAVPASRGWPIWGVASLVAPVLVTFMVRDAFFGPGPKPTGESALIGFFAVILLGTLGLVSGIACGAVSIYMKEFRWIGIAGILANLVTALVLVQEVGSL